MTDSRIRLLLNCKQTCTWVSSFTEANLFFWICFHLHFFIVFTRNKNCTKESGRDRLHKITLGIILNCGVGDRIVAASRVISWWESDSHRDGLDIPKITILAKYADQGGCVSGFKCECVLGYNECELPGVSRSIWKENMILVKQQLNNTIYP